MTKNEIKEIALKTARLVDDKKGENVVIYDLEGKSSLCDYVIIATVTSAPHLNALEQEVSTALKEDGIYKLNREGAQSPAWRVSDYGGFMLHLMTEESRAFYTLDKIFSFGSLVNWEVKPVKKVVKEVVKTVKKVARKSVKKVAKTAKKTVKKSTKKATKKTTKKTTKKIVKKAVKKTTSKIKVVKKAKKTVKKIIKQKVKKVAKKTIKKALKKKGK